uniref:Uncharacterized protein n=1 Tax=Knipowitschia caucasica TaxID=637954 RepID=A0AAV2JJ06_KNICA
MLTLYFFYSPRAHAPPVRAGGDGLPCILIAAAPGFAALRMDTASCGDGLSDHGFRQTQQQQDPAVNNGFGQCRVGQEI